MNTLLVCDLAAYLQAVLGAKSFFLSDNSLYYSDHMQQIWYWSEVSEVKSLPEIPILHAILCMSGFCLGDQGWTSALYLSLIADIRTFQGYEEGGGWSPPISVTTLTQHKNAIGFNGYWSKNKSGDISRLIGCFMYLTSLNQRYLIC